MGGSLILEEFDGFGEPECCCGNVWVSRALDSLIGASPTPTNQTGKIVELGHEVDALLL